MAGQVLYRKWRPQRFDEIVGQEHVSRTLERALVAGRVAHAYLFAGPRGTGKTSTARILAKAVNCTGGPPVPCNTCPTCVAVNEGRAMDLIEIDAASNRGIDEIRDLRDKVRFFPSEARFKFYILDEAHMLTTEAFNALLKTLEEPPAHAIFVLATTEPQRIPATILSRCQRFDFRRLRLADVVCRLEAIVQAEGLHATRPALDLIARSATGSMRDAESLLDQLGVFARDGTLDIAEVQAVLGMRGSEQVPTLIDALLGGDVPAALHIVQQAVDDGVDLRQFNRELVSYLRGLLFLAVTRDGADLLDVPREALEEMRARAQRTTAGRLTAWVRRFSLLDADLRAGWYGQLPLELALVEAVLPAEEPTPPRAEHAAERPRPQPQAPASRPAAPAKSSSPRPAATPASTPPQAEPAPPAAEQPLPAAAEADETEGPMSGPLTLEHIAEAWPRVVEGIRPMDPSVQALLHPSYCRPIGVEGRIVVLGFRFDFHKGKIEEVRNRRIVEQVLSKVLKENLGVRCVMDEASAAPNRRKQATNRQQAQQDPRVRAAANIFNARIVEVEGGEEEQGKGG
jgi:DNA polymerase-3 subunit gamma/tau